MTRSEYEKKADQVYSIYEKLYRDVTESLKEILESENRSMLILHCAKIAGLMNQALAIDRESSRSSARA